jgi:hypothetical protein
MFVQIKSKSLCGGFSKRIKVFSTSLIVNADADPVFFGPMLGVGVADKQFGLRG